MWCLQLVLLTACHASRDTDVTSWYRRARVPGAVRLGALFAVHGAPAAAAAGRAACGPVREHYGIQRVEATLQVCISFRCVLKLRPLLGIDTDICQACDFFDSLC